MEEHVKQAKTDNGVDWAKPEGPIIAGVKKAIAEHAGEDAAKMIVAGVAFEVTEIRPLVALG